MQAFARTCDSVAENVVGDGPRAAVEHHVNQLRRKICVFCTGFHKEANGEVAGEIEIAFQWLAGINQDVGASFGLALVKGAGSDNSATKSSAGSLYGIFRIIGEGI